MPGLPRQVSQGVLLVDDPGRDGSPEQKAADGVGPGGHDPSSAAHLALQPGQGYPDTSRIITGPESSAPSGGIPVTDRPAGALNGHERKSQAQAFTGASVRTGASAIGPCGRRDDRGKEAAATKSGRNGSPDRRRTGKQPWQNGTARLELRPSARLPLAWTSGSRMAAAPTRADPTPMPVNSRTGRGLPQTRPAPLALRPPISPAPWTPPTPSEPWPQQPWLSHSTLTASPRVRTTAHRSRCGSPLQTSERSPSTPWTKRLPSSLNSPSCGGETANGPKWRQGTRTRVWQASTVRRARCPWQTAAPVHPRRHTAATRRSRDHPGK
jgi:hypothetical protein